MQLFKLTKGIVWWREAAVAQLVKGDSLYMPRADLASSELLSLTRPGGCDALPVSYRRISRLFQGG